MKSSSLILTLITFFFLSVSCQNWNQTESGIKAIGEVNEGDCLLEEFKIQYPSFKITFKFVYSEDNKVISTQKYIDDELENRINYSYSSSGLLKGFERYFNDILTDKISLSHLGDSVELIAKKFVDEKWVKSSVLHLHYNENLEMLSVKDFARNKDGEWDLVGSGYKYEWEEGNLSKAENWVFQVDTLGDNIKADDYIKRNSYIINERAFAFQNKYYYDNNEIELFYESTFEYDDKNNPFRDVSIASFIFPSDFNPSVNNTTSIVKAYTSGEKLILNATYVGYNEKNYPTKALVKVKFVENDEESIQSEYQIEFVYKNCK